MFDGSRVVVDFGGVSRVLYTARSRAYSRVWTMYVNSCGMVDVESESSELQELTEAVSLIQSRLIGWMLMDKLKSNDWLDMEENELLKWLNWMIWKSTRCRSIVGGDERYERYLSL